MDATRELQIRQQREAARLQEVAAAAFDLRFFRVMLDSAILEAHRFGISNYQIAAAYGVTEATVRARLKRIKREREQ